MDETKPPILRLTSAHKLIRFERVSSEAGERANESVSVGMMSLTKITLSEFFYRKNEKANKA